MSRTQPAQKSGQHPHRRTAKPKLLGGIGSYLVSSESAYPFSQVSQIASSRRALMVLEPLRLTLEKTAMLLGLTNPPRVREN